MKNRGEQHHRSIVINKSKSCPILFLILLGIGTSLHALPVEDWREVTPTEEERDTPTQSTLETRGAGSLSIVDTENATPPSLIDNLGFPQESESSMDVKQSSSLYSGLRQALDHYDLGQQALEAEGAHGARPSKEQLGSDSKSSIGNLSGVPFEQVEGSASKKTALNINFHDHKDTAFAMSSHFLSDPTKFESKHSDAKKISDAAESYRISFLEEEERITSQQVPPAGIKAGCTLVLRLEQNTPLVENNLQKLAAAAKTVDELHQQKEICLQKAEESHLSPEKKERWKEAAVSIEESISFYLKFAEKLQGLEFNKARIIRVQAHQAFFTAQASQADAQGDKEKATRFHEAAEIAQDAIQHFEKASEIGISAEEKKAWIGAGDYRFNQAQALADGDVIKAEKYQPMVTAKLAAGHFRRAYEAGVSAEEKSALIYAGNNTLKEAQADDKGHLDKADVFRKVAVIALSGAEYFKRASQEETTELEKEALIYAGDCSINEAQACLEGDKIHAHLFFMAADAANSASVYFKNAFQEEISSQKKEIWFALGTYRLEEARACVAGDRVKKANFLLAACTAKEALAYFNKGSEKDVHQGLWHLAVAKLYANQERKLAKDYSYEMYLAGTLHTL